MGVSFERRLSVLPEDDDEDDRGGGAGAHATICCAVDMLALRAALDEVRFGVVLLDQELRAQFINRAFRRMWRLPDHKAESKPPFVALMYHGRDTRAYDIPAGELDAYIAERVEHVKVGRSDAARRSARQRRSVAHAMRDPAERRPDAELHATSPTLSGTPTSWRC